MRKLRFSPKVSGYTRTHSITFKRQTLLHMSEINFGIIQGKWFRTIYTIASLLVRSSSISFVISCFNSIRNINIWYILCNSGAWEYIEKTRDLVHNLERRAQKCKDNVEEIQKIMATWKTHPLFERKEGKHDSLLNLDDREDRLKKRWGSVSKYWNII